jgi:hypothetical protein
MRHSLKDSDSSICAPNLSATAPSCGSGVSHSESRLKNTSFPSLQYDGQVFIFRFPDVFAPHVVSLTEIDFSRFMLDFLYPPIKMVVTDETTREEVLNPVVAFLQFVPFARPYHMSYDSDFLVFKKHRRFHVALPVAHVD